MGPTYYVCVYVCARKYIFNSSCVPSSCVTTAGTSNELDVQNEWEENTHTSSRIGSVKILKAEIPGCPSHSRDLCY